MREIITQEDVKQSVKWAMERIKDRETGDRFEFLFKEHAIGMATIGGTISKCSVGFNIDYDLRCECCGEILELGSVDIQGPAHTEEKPTGPVVRANSIAELMTALGVTSTHNPLDEEAAAKRIHETVAYSEGCEGCSDWLGQRNGEDPE